MTPTIEALRLQLAERNQTHLIAHWDRLQPAERQQLANQLTNLDWELFDELAASGFDAEQEKADQKALGERAQSPPALRLNQDYSTFTRSEAIQAGERAIAAGECAQMIVAGGLGTRLGSDQPKGMFPLGPLSGRTLFQILFEQILATGRAFGRSIPLYIMTSPATHDATEAFLREHRWFGLPEKDVRLFQQSTLWSFDKDSKRLLLESPGSLFLGPDGHGGMLDAFAKSGSLADAKARGVKHLCYGQIDNPLTSICDPLLLGGHILAKSELTTQVVAKVDPMERVGNVVAVDGQMRMIEYIHFPREIAEQKNSAGELKFWAGNVAVHVFDIAFLDRLSQLKRNPLPLHWALKKVPHIDDRGEIVEPAEANAWRFERFIFDLLPLAKNALVVEAEREAAFAPVKNAAGEKADTAATSQQLMSDLYKRWLRAAGAKVADDIVVEINPLYARNAEELARKVPPGMKVEEDTYFV
jgi:UDP-N-acetylglucosamine/UDP-N-acetylgalactosamine diphosphorylase